MGVHARWHGELAVRQQRGEDVFADVGSPPAPADPVARIEQLLEAESRLFGRGVSCEIRDRSDTSCSACPLYATDLTIAELCRVGREQERVCTSYAAQRASSPS